MRFYKKNDKSLSENSKIFSLISLENRIWKYSGYKNKMDCIFL